MRFDSVLKQIEGSNLGSTAEAHIRVSGKFRIDENNAFPLFFARAWRRSQRHQRGGAADARFCLEMLAAQLRIVKEQILENDRRILTSARETELGLRLMEILGFGPLLASAIVATVPDPAIFRSGRNLAAWVGLVARQNSSGRKKWLGGITKAGHQYLRQMPIAGAMAVVRYAERDEARQPWLRPYDLGDDGRRRTVSGAAGRIGNTAPTSEPKEVGKGGQQLMQQAG